MVPGRKKERKKEEQGHKIPTNFFTSSKNGRWEHEIGLTKKNKIAKKKLDF
jgi:hypothetical protein